MVTGLTALHHSACVFVCVNALRGRVHAPDVCSPHLSCLCALIFDYRVSLLSERCR